MNDAADFADHRKEAADALAAQVPGVQIEFDEITGGPKHIMAPAKFLTPASDMNHVRADEVVSRFVDDHMDLFGHGSAALQAGNSRITREDLTPHNGMKTLVWQQELDGIPFFKTTLRWLSNPLFLLVRGACGISACLLYTPLFPIKKSALPNAWITRIKTSFG